MRVARKAIPVFGGKGRVVFPQSSSFESSEDGVLSGFEPGSAVCWVGSVLVAVQSGDFDKMKDLSCFFGSGFWSGCVGESLIWCECWM